MIFGTISTPIFTAWPSLFHASQEFSSNDARERGFWKDYMKAYEDMICNTATDDAPWYVVRAVTLISRSHRANRSAHASAHGALGNVAAVEAHTGDISRKSHSPGPLFFC